MASACPSTSGAVSSVASKDQPAPASSQMILRAATSCELLRLKHQHAPRPRRGRIRCAWIEWTRGAQGSVIPCLRQRTEPTERGDQHALIMASAPPASMQSACPRRIRFIRLADGVATGGAGAVDAGVGAAHLEQAPDAHRGAVLPHSSAPSRGRRDRGRARRRRSPARRWLNRAPLLAMITPIESRLLRRL